MLEFGASSLRSLIFELVQQTRQPLDRFFRVPPFGLQHSLRPLVEIGAQNLDQAGGGKPLSILHDPDIGAKSVGPPREFSGRASVQAKFV